MSVVAGPVARPDGEVQAKLRVPSDQSCRDLEIIRQFQGPDFIAERLCVACGNPESVAEDPCGMFMPLLPDRSALQLLPVPPISSLQSADRRAPTA